jgi:glucose-1-phosphate thymidylyltransferase
MDVLILCGGYAKRLEPVSEFMPKPLLPVNGKPVVEHLLGKIGELPSDMAIDRVIINTNRKFEEHFKYWLELRNPSYGNRLVEVVEPTASNNEKLGAIGGIDYCIRNANIKGDLLLLAGDNFFDFGLAPLAEHFKSTRKPLVSLYDLGSKDDATRFGVVEVDGDVITGFEEKPKEPKTTIISSGIYFFPAGTLPMITEYLSSGNHPDKVGSFLEWLIRKAEVHGMIQEGLWVDIGTLESYRKLLSDLEISQ